MPEVGRMSPSEIRDALLKLPPDKRIFVVTNPKKGERKIVAIRRNTSDTIDYDYESEPE
ncbi:hypothetical protein ES708_21791 [subsurface metagenome]